MPTASRVTRKPSARPPAAPPAWPIKRFTVAEYHRLIDTGILKSGDPYELLEGWIVQKMPNNPPHASTVTRTYRRIDRLLGDEFVVRCQQPVSIAAAGSEPEPDVVVAAGPDNRYTTAHPTPRDVHLIVEVSNSSLPRDRSVKFATYARAKVPVYWIVNLETRQVEVYTNPRGGRNPTYRTRTDYARGDTVPVVIAGKTVGTLAVSDLIP
jgi:Uma2 family endonuclease